MTQILKIIPLIILVTFLFNVPYVQAAVKYVPTPQQLQPSPPGIKPNLSGNVNYIDPTGQDQSEEEGGNNAEETKPAPANEAAKNPRQSLLGNIIALPAQNSAAGKIAWWLVILVLAGAGTWLVKKRYDKK